GDSAALAARSRESLAATVLTLARAVLDDIGRRRPDLFTARFRDLEARRLGELVNDWLDVERARGQAFRVVALERRQQVTLGGLELTTRVDRIDELADGSLAVIDYKTGRRVATDGWFDARVSEPQLPLYSVQADAPLGAALLARVRNDAAGCRFVGLSRLDGIATGVTTAGDDAPDWQPTLARWRHALTALAAEFVAGRADPTPSPAACEYCPLGSLCRVDAHGGDAPDDG
ncbi:MAG: PD-(D/E)XK nuclease family protein, partial [Gammaproteobacteria bacterium]|nr:PD-(D/E)XK nuclease family protein [Gammaproteobacteria bacterium]